MEQTPTTQPDMANDPARMIKISPANYERLKKYGYAGESLNTALDRVLDLAEKAEKAEKKK